LLKRHGLFRLPWAVAKWKRLFFQQFDRRFRRQAVAMGILEKLRPLGLASTWFRTSGTAAQPSPRRERGPTDKAWLARPGSSDSFDEALTSGSLCSMGFSGLRANLV